ncbi:hypothetical protein ACP275_13G053700 [Erythranthe tilingii]
MILNCGAVFVQWRVSSRARTTCSASPSATAEQLRHQLDNLQKEADNTRDKASNARLRLMRLSEAAEKLRRQAAVSIQTGKENDARDLLFQKKKVMQALEKLKGRIELFDQLSAKLNEAISMKESLLIENMGLDVEVSETEPTSPIRIVSPSQETPNNTDADLESIKDQQLHIIPENQVDPLAKNEFSGEKRLTSYEDFMGDIDQQLKRIEDELEMFLRFSSLLLENKEKPEYAKVQHVTEILAGVSHIRERIGTIKQTR